MKRKTIGQIAAIMLSAAVLSGCGEQASEQAETSAEVTTAAETTTETTIETTTETTTAETTTTASTEQDMDFSKASYDDCTLEITEAGVVSKNSDGSADIVVKMLFTNNSDSSTMASTVFMVNVFQDGVECETAILWDSDYDTYSPFKEIKPGYSYDVYYAYTVPSMESDFEIEITGLFDFNDRLLAYKAFHF